MNVVELTRSLVRTPSVSGNEAACVGLLADVLPMGLQNITGLNTPGSDNVTTFAVLVEDLGDKGVAVGIVLDRFHFRRDIVLVPFPIADNTECIFQIYP